MKKDKMNAEYIADRLKKARQELITAYTLSNFADYIQPLNDFVEALEKEIIQYALIISEENQKKAAFLLGLKPPTLCEKMKRYDIKLDNSLKQTALPFLRSIEEIGRLISTKEFPIPPKPED